MLAKAGPALFQRSVEGSLRRVSPAQVMRRLASPAHMHPAGTEPASISERFYCNRWGHKCGITVHPLTE